MFENKVGVLVHAIPMNVTYMRCIWNTARSIGYIDIDNIYTDDVVAYNMVCFLVVQFTMRQRMPDIEVLS